MSDIKFSYGVILLTLGGFIFFAVAFFPGFMTYDSFAQLAQAHTQIFTDWHPPVMAWLWSKLNIIYDKPQNLLFLHLALLWSGLYIWYKNTENTKLFILIGFLPWVANFEGVLWKDVGMAFCLLFTVGLLSGKNLSKSSGLLAILLLLYAFMVRYNAPAAVAPIIWYLYAKLFPQHKYYIKIIGTVLILASLFFLQNIFTTQIIHAKKTPATAYMMIDDLVYLSTISEKSVLPGANYETLKTCSKEIIGDTQLVGRIFCQAKLAEYLAKPEDLKNLPEEIHKKIKTAWVDAVRTNPMEYIKFRLEAYGYLLRSPSEKPYYYWESGTGKTKSVATQIVKYTVAGTAHITPFLFKPYWWFITALLLLGISFFKIENIKNSVILIRVLLISALFYMLSYIPMTPLADLRYTYWSTLAITLAIILFFTSLLRTHK